jgi:hypothetical protein
MEKMQSKHLFATLAVAVILAITINVAYAETVGSVMCTDGLGNAKSLYETTDHVWVQVMTVDPPANTVDIMVKTDLGVPVTGVFPNLAVGDQVDVGTFSPGYYAVWVSGHQEATFVAGGTFHVIPESVLGALTAVVACFGSFAAIGIIKRKQTKSK